MVILVSFTVSTTSCIQPCSVRGIPTTILNLNTCILVLCPFYSVCPIKSLLHPIDHVYRVALITETISQTQKHEIQINLVKGKYEKNISKQLREMIYSGVVCMMLLSFHTPTMIFLYILRVCLSRCLSLLNIGGTRISIAIIQSEIMYQCTYILLCLKLNRRGNFKIHSIYCLLISINLLLKKIKKILVCII